MKTVFADTGYWIALLDPQDTLHSKAVNLSITLSQAQIITSQMVLTEVLNHFSKSGNFLRYAAASLIESLKVNPSISIIFQTDDIFQQALNLYKQRPDQAWSHTDCSSFCIMKQQGLLESLAYDKHFEQAGFIALLR
jgi:predicted nucleic acid-binding protein